MRLEGLLLKELARVTEHGSGGHNEIPITIEEEDSDTQTMGGEVTPP